MTHREAVQLFKDAQKDLAAFRTKLDNIASAMINADPALPYPYGCALEECVRARDFTRVIDHYLDVALLFENAHARQEDKYNGKA